MCQICILLDKSLPSPKNLVKQVNEANVPSAHHQELYNKAVKAAMNNAENPELYVIQLIREVENNHWSKLDMLRNS